MNNTTHQHQWPNTKSFSLSSFLFSLNTIKRKRENSKVSLFPVKVTTVLRGNNLHSCWGPVVIKKNHKRVNTTAQTIYDTQHTYPYRYSRVYIPNTYHILRSCLLLRIIGWFLNLGIRSRKKCAVLMMIILMALLFSNFFSFFVLMLMIMMLVFYFTLEHVQHRKCTVL